VICSQKLLDSESPEIRAGELQVCLSDDRAELLAGYLTDVVEIE
jgi:hypothetical protein